LNQKIQSSKVVLYSWVLSKPCVNPFTDPIKETDLADPKDIPTVENKPCWSDFNEISIYKFEDYLDNFVNLPYDKSNGKFLWTPETIPVASNGNIRDWQKEENPPCYAD
jgi:hypothetical protein